MTRLNPSKLLSSVGLPFNSQLDHSLPPVQRCGITKALINPLPEPTVEPALTKRADANSTLIQEQGGIDTLALFIYWFVCLFILPIYLLIADSIPCAHRLITATFSLLFFLILNMRLPLH